MIRLNQSQSRSPSLPPDSAPPLAPNEPAVSSASVYGLPFWFAYVANLALMTTVCMLFRYADLVTILGGGEEQLGWIVGFGMIGSLAFRLVQGRAIDQCGARLVWMVSLAVVIVSLLGHLLVQRVNGPSIYLVRTLYQCSLAAAFGASITYISLRAPLKRMAEVIGILGTSGFLGMVLGSQLGDFICSGENIQRWQVDRLFVGAAAFSTLSLVFVFLATRETIPRRRLKRLPLLWLVRRYHPGWLLVMGAVMGVGFALPGTFLVPFVETRGLSGVAVFFTAYAISAFALRMATKRLPQQIGIPPTVLLGAAAMAASMLLYLVVDATWTLVIPGVMAGAAHALLFPSVVTGGSTSFPIRHRGTGTTLILAMFDLGQLIGLPLAGSLVDYSPSLGLPAYPTLFVSMAAVVILVSAGYAMRLRSLRSPREAYLDAAIVTSNEAPPLVDKVTYEEPVVESNELTIQKAQAPVGMSDLVSGERPSGETARGSAESFRPTMGVKDNLNS